MFLKLPGSDQWTTSIYSKHASAIAKGKAAGPFMLLHLDFEMNIL